jgi:hypothetical protein
VAKHPPTRAEALAFAHAVNLRVSDIPEATTIPRHGKSSGQEKHEETACERLSPHGHLFPHSHIAEVISPWLQRGHELEVEQISSAVTVVSDERLIPSELAALQAPAVRACLARVLTRNFSVKRVRDAHWGRFTISRLPVSAPGTTATLGLRIAGTLNFAYSEVTLPVYVDALGFATGHAVVTVIAASVTQPVPTSTERELVALLLARATAHTI